MLITPAMPIPAVFSTPRTAIMTVFAGFGVAVGAIAGSMPTVARQAGLDDRTLGLAITCFSIANLAALVLGGKLASRASNRAMLMVTTPLFALFTIVTLTANSPVSFTLAYVLFGIAAGLTDLFMNAEGTAIELDQGRPIFTTFHGSVSTGLTVMALLASYLSTQVSPLATALVASAVLLLGMVLAKRNLRPRQLAIAHAARMSTIPNRRGLIVLGLVAGLSVSAETAAILWSAKLLDTQAPALAAIAGLGAAFFGLCNAMVRFPGDRLRARFGDLPLMMGSIIVAVAGFAVLGFSTGFAASVAGFALVGLGTAIIFPCIVALAAGLVPQNKAGAISFVSLLSAGPRIISPWAFGVISAALGISFAFGLFACAMLIALALVFILQRLR